LQSIHLYELLMGHNNLFVIIFQKGA
jgi:hypothetical protein